jgi:hypothetical protein
MPHWAAATARYLLKRMQASKESDLCANMKKNGKTCVGRSVEQDPRKLSELIQEINELLAKKQGRLDSRS